jgi:hypothetical protein
VQDSPTYTSGAPRQAATCRHDAEFLKDALIRAIHETHPAHIFAVNAERMQSTAGFLRNFGRLFTLNYDLLLYWTLVHSENGLNGLFKDGFKNGESGLEWADFPTQGVLYLHGALHLFQEKERLEKVKYQAAVGGTLIEQIAERISSGHAPLFVCEGTNEQKLVHIRGSKYLRYCFRTFQSANGVLFVYGHSLNDSDQHILDSIAQSQITSVFVSLHGDPGSEHNQNIQLRAQSIQLARSPRKLAVAFYQAETANLW